MKVDCSIHMYFTVSNIIPRHFFAVFDKHNHSILSFSVSLSDKVLFKNSYVFHCVMYLWHLISVCLCCL